MSNVKKKPVTPVTKPYLTGKPVDSRSTKRALGFFGMMVIVAFMTFLVCSMTGFDNMILRIGANVVVILLALAICYNNGSGKGTDDVNKGEILYQRKEKGNAVESAEEAACFHKLKGFMIGLEGMLPFLIVALILSFTATRQVTTAGALPSWMGTYIRREEIGVALESYSTASPVTVEHIARLIVRLSSMPFVSMIGTENRNAILMMERLSPLIYLLPVIAFGLGYLKGIHIRTQVHTEIAENNKKRIRKERRERRKRVSAAPKGPQQLN